MSLRSQLRDLYHERTNYQFMRRTWRWALISGIMLGAGFIAFFARGGLNLGIDFEGGTSWEFTVAAGQAASSGEIRDVMREFDLGDSKIIIVNENGARVQAETLPRSEQAKITAGLAEYANIDAADVSINDVGPTWGRQVSEKALRALIVFFFVIAIYLSLRFEWKMAASAIIAVIHDILITVGVYAITGFEVTPATVIAFLTILGFSLYDTVVVFDKVKENEVLLGTSRGMTYSEMVNRSLNQVLARSLNTSFVALLPVASLLVVGSDIMGALSLRDFGLALFVGLLTGAYSSIFVATPILAKWREREPRMRALRERSESQAARSVSAPSPVDAPAGAAEGSGVPDAAPATASTTTAVIAPPGEVVPRPRRARGRKRR
ncbi:MAG: protein translocase subunit SecF [Acidimicrobiia bacterium]